MVEPGKWFSAWQDHSVITIAITHHHATSWSYAGGKRTTAPIGAVNAEPVVMRWIGWTSTNNSMADGDLI
jgi:hypothetical protein